MSASRIAAQLGPGHHPQRRRRESSPPWPVGPRKPASSGGAPRAKRTSQPMLAQKTVALRGNTVVLRDVAPEGVPSLTRSPPPSSFRFRSAFRSWSCAIRCAAGRSAIRWRPNSAIAERHAIRRSPTACRMPGWPIRPRRTASDTDGERPRARQAVLTLNVSSKP